MDTGAVDLAPRLKRALRRKKITQAELARRLEIQRSTVSGWFNGTAKPHLDMLERLARELGTSAAWLIGGSA